MLETDEAAEAFLALLARPAEETNHGIFELLCEATRSVASNATAEADGATGGVEVTWKQVHLDVVEERLDWSADQPLRYP